MVEVTLKRTGEEQVPADRNRDRWFGSAAVEEGESDQEGVRCHCTLTADETRDHVVSDVDAMEAATFKTRWPKPTPSSSAMPPPLFLGAVPTAAARATVEAARASFSGRRSIRYTVGTVVHTGRLVEGSVKSTLRLQTASPPLNVFSAPV